MKCLAHFFQISSMIWLSNGSWYWKSWNGKTIVINHHYVKHENHFIYNFNMFILGPKSHWYKLGLWSSSNASHSIHIPNYLVACCIFIKIKSWNKSIKIFNKLNLELNTWGNIQHRFWDVDVDLLPRTLQTLVALKSKMISNLHIIQTIMMYYLLIKSYPCTTCFIFELGFRCKENQTTVLSVGQIIMSCNEA